MKDIVERHKLKDDTILDALTDAIYSSVGSLSNPHRLAMTTGSLMGRSTTDDTIKGYLGYLEDAPFLLDNLADRIIMEKKG